MKIQLHKISNGIFWLEVPSIDYSVLCGSPADAIKHLKKTGHVRSITANGQTFQTGPKAILLSDIPIQGGQFSNFCEFPVLQMLYMQGLIIPGHPNNTGLKPKLIGSASQLKNQMEYIKRGNYGLYNEEELASCGYNSIEQKELMAIKKHFAFGRIKDSSELLSTEEISDSSSEVHGGLKIQRLELNKFLFTFEDESSVVDLNLSEGETYVSPIHHDHTYPEKGFFSVIQSGNGDGWDTERQAMNSVIAIGGDYYLVDCGPNMSDTLESVGLSVHDISGVFLTHCHDDHIAGLTTLFSAEKRINLFATAPVRLSISKKLSALLDVNFDTLSAFLNINDVEEDKWFSVGMMEVSASYSPHPVECTTFSFRVLWKGGYQTYTHLSDTTSFAVLGQMHEKGVISDERLQAVKDSYLRPVDLKKIDCGGGMIHGESSDFRDDKSSKLILSHVARVLTPGEEMFGHSSGFGATDVLIKGVHEPFYYDEVVRAFARRYRALDPSKFDKFKYGKIVHFSPGDHILEEHRMSGSVFILLRGTASRLDRTRDEERRISKGSIIGDRKLVMDQCPFIYKSLGHTTLMRIPEEVYKDFLLRNALDEQLRDRFETLDKWERVSLFSGIVISDRLSQIVTEAIEIPPDQDTASLLLGKSGSLQHVIVSLDQNSWSLLSSKSDDEIDGKRLYAIPIELVRQFPIIHWRLFSQRTSDVSIESLPDLQRAVEGF